MDDRSPLPPHSIARLEALNEDIRGEQAATTATIVTAIVVILGALLFTLAAWSGLSRAEAAYQMEQRV